MFYREGRRKCTIHSLCFSVHFVQTGRLLVNVPLSLPSCQTSSCCPSNHTAVKKRFKNPSALPECIQQCCSAPLALSSSSCALIAHCGSQLSQDNKEIQRGFSSGFPISELSFSLLSTAYFILSMLNALSLDLSPFQESYFRILPNMPG